MPDIEERKHLERRGQTEIKCATTAPLVVLKWGVKAAWKKVDVDPIAGSFGSLTFETGSFFPWHHYAMRALVRDGRYR